MRSRLAKACGIAAERIEIKVIRTTGDAIQDRPLAEAGGKGLFTKEIEEALLAGAIDLAVHSSKDMPTVLPAGLDAVGLPAARGCARRLHQPQGAKACATCRSGAVVGTASLRRQALVKRLRPDLAIVPLRGNVETRLRKLEAGDADATLLALAGLKRLGLPRGDRDLRDRRISAGGRPRRDRHRNPHRRRPNPRAGRRHRRCRHRNRARRRARLPRRARRLVPHADRRPCAGRRRHACAFAA